MSRLVTELKSGPLHFDREKAGYPTLLEHLFVNSRRDSQELFIDISVYTRNRLFRLLGSSKFGKPSAASLHLAHANKVSGDNTAQYGTARHSKALTLFKTLRSASLRFAPSTISRISTTTSSTAKRPR